MIADEIPCDIKDGVATLKHMEDNHGLAQRMALIRFYFHHNPKTMSEFSESWNQLVFALRFDGKMKVEEIRKG